MITDTEKVVAVLRGTLFRDVRPFKGQRILFVSDGMYEYGIKMFEAGVVSDVRMRPTLGGGALVYSVSVMWSSRDLSDPFSHKCSYSSKFIAVDTEK